MTRGLRSTKGGPTRIFADDPSPTTLGTHCSQQARYTRRVERCANGESSAALRAECPMTSALIHPRVGHPVNDLGSSFAPPASGPAHRPSPLGPGTPGARSGEASPSPRRDGQAGPTGAFNPRGVAQLTHDAALVAVGEGHPQSALRPTLAWDVPGEWVRACPKSSRQEPTVHHRRSPRPLAQPAFGPPADGLRCHACKRWFHRSHFWRANTRSFVKRCADCIRQNRHQEH
jgi:hypothetical protein